MQLESVISAVKVFTSNFIKNPFIHRSEHSLHIALYNELLKHQTNTLLIQINKKPYYTSVIHKEYPGRKKYDISSNKMVKRTQIDIVILTSNQNSNSLNDFHEGNLEIDYAFELSLEYNIKHLCWDIFKFISGSNRSINDKNYIIHLYNKNRIKSYFSIDKINGDEMWGNNLTVIESSLNLEYEWCYYLIQLCIDYSLQKDDLTYKKIIMIVLFFVGKKNIEYNRSYLLKETEIQRILSSMKFLFLDVNPKNKEKVIELTNI